MVAPGGGTPREQPDPPAPRPRGHRAVTRAPFPAVGALWVIQDPSEVQPPSATLSILRARPGDAGCYVCRVTLEIPRYATATGNGTVLTVSAAADAGHGAGLAWGLVGALGGAFLLLGLAVLGYRHWHRRTDTAIYLNVLPRSARTPKK
ncbi:uncharacterized protein [Anser cygnoides]|uniref:uncharacterized protein isoform X5 n=1 Tax=Anser cygnoides TaxID=8845 RepID=UPI0034D2DE00